MRFKIFIVFGMIFSLLLAGLTMAQSEEELVAKFLNKTEKKQIKKVGFFVVNGSYGKLLTAGDYNNYVHEISPAIAAFNNSDSRVEGIYRSKELFAGFGIMTSSKMAATLGFNYWLRMGSDKTGDYNLSLVNMNDPIDHDNFNLKSEIQIYGFSGGVDYYLLNPPDRDGLLHGLALKVGANGGFYFAKWEVWEGFTGYNLYLESQEIITGKLTGQAPGASISLTTEYPVKLMGLVVEMSAKYQYLNFTKMKWYNDLDHENVVVYGPDQRRVELDLSGPRAQFGLKRYFSW
jgi:hypothetical protein